MGDSGSSTKPGVLQRARDRTRNTVALLRLLSYLSPGRAALLIGAVLVATLLPSATAVAIGVLVARLNERAGTDEGIGGLIPILTLVGVLLIGDLLTQTLITPIRERVAVEINGRIRQRTRRALLAFDSVEHLDAQEMRAAAELPVYDEGLFSIGQAVESQLWIAAKYVGAIAAGLLVATFSPWLAVLALVLMVIQRSILHEQYGSEFGSGLATMINARRQEQYWRSVVDSSTGGKELRLFQFHDHLFGRFAEAQEVRADFHEGIMFRALPGQWKPFLLTAVAVGAITITATRSALGGDLEVARLTVVLGAALVLSQLGQFGYEWLSIDAAGPQLAGLAALEGHQDQRLPPAPASHGTPRLEFERVCFRYPGATEDVLDDVSFVLEPGELVAIVGENGAGKTTLLHLLAGFYAPTSGRILVDGVDLRDAPMEDWRRRIGLISQNFVHYELSALDNVALASLAEPSLADAELAALAAGAADLVEGLPRSWDTILSRRLRDGVELSGGQWQRIALARALYASTRGSSVLILDEPTANLDVDAEVALFDQLLEHASGATAIVVSHRFSTVRRAQRILVIDGGRLAEDGSHQALIERNGTYSRLYTLQAERFRTDSATELGEEG